MATQRQASQARVQKVADAEAAKSRDTTRHRCFVSYHVDDEIEVTQFLSDFGDQIIATVVGVTADDDFVNSDNTDYIMEQIRERYLKTTTVTIILVGKCTKTRRFVDWEVYSSLRDYVGYGHSGLVAMNLPSQGKTGALPARVLDNVDADKKYARYWTYPISKADLRSNINIAFADRTAKASLINNTRERRQANSAC